MKRILITGANSYIGTSVEKYLLQWPNQYHVDTIDMIDGSWREKSFVGYDSVFHVAGIAHQNSGKITEERKQLYYKVNTNLTIDTAKKAKADGVKQFIFMSSIIIYGGSGKIGEKKVITRETKPAPEGAYGDSKLQAELGITPLQDDHFSICILRPPMIYGPGSKGNYRLLEKVALLLPFFPDIENERSMLQIDNLCKYVKLMIDTKRSGIYFPQNSEYVCTSDMVKQIACINGKCIHLTRIFNPLLRLLSGKLSVVDKVFGNLVYEVNNLRVGRGMHEVVEGLVSVIMPCYNAEDYIAQSINSVINQSYILWELIVIDDFSKDSSRSIVQEISAYDSRIKLICQESNKGAGAARNVGVNSAKGQYIAFLDSDDLWEPNKLETQVNFMKDNGINFTCSDYAVIDENSNLTGEVRKAKIFYDYDILLKHCPGNSTIMYDSGQLGKFFIPPIRRRNDYLMWLQVIKKSGSLIGISSVLSKYRIHSAGISYNKFPLIKYHYNIYHKIEKLPFWKTYYLIAYWTARTLLKKITKGLRKNEFW
jgi:glycosyltransferase involved in cell wall biosynthesis/nucleoside-diphosphate-sugar epimerase